MSSQPPSRPWLRLASIRLPPPDPAPAPVPAAPAPARPLLSLPTFRSVAPPPAPTPNPTQTQDPVGNAASPITTAVASVATSPVLRSNPPPTSSSPKTQMTNYGPSTPVQTQNTFPSSAASVQASPTSSPRTQGTNYGPSSPVQTQNTFPSSAASVQASPTIKASSPVSKPQSPRDNTVPTSPLLTYSQSPKEVKQSNPSPEPKPKLDSFSQSPKQMQVNATSPKPKAALDSFSQSPKQMAVSATSPKPALLTSPTKPSQSHDKTPPRSPITRPIAPPPSPLSLPPSHAETNNSPPEAELQKTVLIHQPPNRPHANAWRAGKHEHSIGKQVAHSPPGEKKEKGKKQHYSGASTRIITITGENSGAMMEVNIRSPGEDKKGMVENGTKSTFINSNVQGINNSIVFNSCCKDNDPGVHIKLSTR